VNTSAFRIVGTRTGRTAYHIPKGTEPMKFSDEFQKAIRLIRADLGQVEHKLAEEICRKQDQHAKEKLASQ
jgi:hypothetical protein